MISGCRFPMILVAITPDCYDRGFPAHPERENHPRPPIEHDTNRKALRETHPVESLLDLRQTLHARAVVLIERPSDALHAAAKALVRIAEQIETRALMPGRMWPRKFSRKFASTYQLRLSTRLSTSCPSLAYWPIAMLRLVTYASNGATTLQYPRLSFAS